MARSRKPSRARSRARSRERTASKRKRTTASNSRSRTQSNTRARSKSNTRARSKSKSRSRGRSNARARATPRSGSQRRAPSKARSKSKSKSKTRGASFVWYHFKGATAKGNDSNKVWAVKVEGSKVTVQWGRRGQGLQHKVYNFGTPAEALAFKQRKVREKTSARKGYTRGRALKA